MKVVWIFRNTMTDVLWHFCSTCMVLSWYFCGSLMVVSCCFLFTFMVLLWYTYGTFMVLSWYFCGIFLVLALSWYFHGNFVVFSWYFHGTFVVLSWYLQSHFRSDYSWVCTCFVKLSIKLIVTKISNTTEMYSSFRILNVIPPNNQQLSAYYSLSSRCFKTFKNDDWGHWSRQLTDTLVVIVILRAWASCCCFMH